LNDLGAMAIAVAIGPVGVMVPGVMPR